MKLRTLMIAGAAAATAVALGATGALADSPGSDAAHACLQGLQRDHYQVIGDTDTAPPLNFHGLAHGIDDNGSFILAGTHGDCVSFAADNTKPSESISINYTKVEVVYNNQ